MAEAEDGEETASPLSVLKRFYVLQEERVEAYRFLESGFSAYLEGAPNYNFELYRSLVHEITQSFKTISEEVLSIQQQFKDIHQMSRIADVLEKVQLAEKEKLEHTVELQLKRQGLSEDPDCECFKQQVTELKEKLQGIVQQINDHLEDLKFESEDLYNSEGADR
ncbi:required for excision 1-B domain-containing protein-like [Babylonia areolata]|uniref:required for excision 1-B domain-containing protein-like n=1 Tax=Babylonia areolata TaxID=304850 RepID=UPI003FCF8619